VQEISLSRRREKSNRNLIIAIAAIVIVLAAAGGWYYTQVYVPQFREERERLLTLITEAAPADLDPALAIDTDSYMIISNVFDGLTKYTRGTTEIEPNLATSWDSPDSMTYIFNLREGVTFHDGTPFNAESVKYSFDRVQEMFGPPSYLFDVINKTEVLDTYTVQVILNYDFAPFPSIMANPVASIVSPTAAEELGDNFNENPVGTGPYMFESWDLGNDLTLVSNEDYYAGPPQIETVIFKSILEATARKTAIEQGELDVVVSGRILPADLPDLQTNPDIEIYEGVGSAIEYLGFNTLVTPLNDSRVREAIAYAIDYEAIIEDAVGGFAERVAGPIPPSILGYKDMPLIERDLAKAQQLLDDAGYSDGFDLTLTYNIDSIERREVAEIIRNSLDEVGITISIKGLDWESALDEYLDMGHEIMLNTWFPDYFDPDSYLFPQFHSWSAAPGGANIFGLENFEIDTLIDEALIETDQDERVSIYGEAQELIVEELPCLFLYVPIEFEVIRFNVENWVYSPSQIFEFNEIFKE
jgi:peptide/nickel transport system substrate-binding protein